MTGLIFEPQAANTHKKMKTLEIKKTPSGQYVYSIIDSLSGVIVPPQYGAFDARSTVDQAKERFRFDEVRDITEHGEF